MVSLDGKLLSRNQVDFVDRLFGDGDSGIAQTTGWRVFSSTEEGIEPGRHTLVIGGYNNKKTAIDERTQVLIDDVQLTATPELHCRHASECDDRNPCTVDTCRAERCLHQGNTSHCTDGFDYGHD